MRICRLLSVMHLRAMTFAFSPNQMVLLALVAMIEGCNNSPPPPRVAIPIPGTSFQIMIPATYEVFRDDGSRPNHVLAQCPQTIVFEPSVDDLPEMNTPVRAKAPVEWRLGSLEQFACVAAEGSLIDSLTSWSSLPINELSNGIHLFSIESSLTTVLLIDVPRRIVARVSGRPESGKEAEKIILREYAEFISAIETKNEDQEN